MLEYEIFDGENPIGKLTAQREGLYWRICAEVASDTWRVIRLYAHTQGRCEKLGIPVPDDEKFRLERRIAASRLELTPQTRITTSAEEPERQSGPEETVKAQQEEAPEAESGQPPEKEGGAPWEPFSGTVLEYPVNGLRRETSKGTELAIEYEAGREFPLMPLFCFCTLRQVDGRLCWVLALDEDGKPILPDEKKPLTSGENVLE